MALDQHAADERVQLEALQARLAAQQEAAVIGGGGGGEEEEGAEQLLAEMPLRPPLPLDLSPEERQALQTHAELVRRWGWRVQGAGTVEERQALCSVPLICGAPLGALDLRIFLHALAEAGSAAVPPGVLRVLRSKACRRAVMFGDALTPAESAALVARLRRTAMPFCCAHGRPTAAPLVDLGQLAAHLAARAGRQQGTAGAASSDGGSAAPLSAARLKQLLALAGKA